MFVTYFLVSVIISYNIVSSHVKGCYYDHFCINQLKWSFWYQMKAPILITPVKLYVQQMLLVKVKTENVAKVR